MLSVSTFVTGLLVAALQLFLGMVFSISAVYSGMFLLDCLTREVEEWALIKKGNTAAGVLYAIVVLSIIIMVEPSLLATVISVHDAIVNGAVLTFVVHLLVLVIALLISVLSVYTILRVIDSMTPDVEEFAEIRKGNVAVALVTGAVLLGVSLVVSSAIKLVVVALTSTI